MRNSQNNLTDAVELLQSSHQSIIQKQQLIEDNEEKANHQIIKLWRKYQEIENAVEVESYNDVPSECQNIISQGLEPDLRIENIQNNDPFLS